MPKATEFGCFFTLKSEPTVGSRLEMDITLPPEILGYAVGTLRCQGEVVRVDKPANNATMGAGKIGVVCAIANYQVIPAAVDVDRDPTAER